MAHFYPEPTLIALPSEQHSGWLAAHIELLVFERQHTREHPDYGRVIVLQSLLQRDTYLRLLDAETKARRELAMPGLYPDQEEPPLAEEAEFPLAPSPHPISCPVPF